MSNTVPLGSSPERQGSDICGLEYFALVIEPIETFQWISNESNIQQSHRACSGNRWNHYAQPIWKTEKVRQNIIHGRQGCCVWANWESETGGRGRHGLGCCAWSISFSALLIILIINCLFFFFFKQQDNIFFFFASFSWAMGMPQAVVPGGNLCCGASVAGGCGWVIVCSAGCLFRD